MKKNQIKNDYEAIIVFSVKKSESIVKELVEKFKDLISNSAELTLFNEWGKKHLFYPINKESDGYYVLFNFKSHPDFPTELNRVLKITNGVLRFLITKGIIKSMTKKRPQKVKIDNKEHEKESENKEAPIEA